MTATGFTVVLRGARHTQAVSHSRGDEITQGRFFKEVVDIPGIINE